MKKAAVIALVLLVLLAGLPFAMGMSDMAPCPSCTGVERPVAMCLAMVSLFVLIVSSSSSVIGSRRQVVRLLLFADPPERPPRVA
jgi:hypothetical protein